MLTVFAYATNFNSVNLILIIFLRGFYLFMYIFNFYFAFIFNIVGVIVA